MRDHKQAFDARRSKKQSIKGILWAKDHPGYDAARMRRSRAEHGREARFMVEDSFSPLTMEHDAVAVTSDWHLPFHHSEFCSRFIDNCKSRGIKSVLVSGDFMDCDHFMKFTRLGWAESFKQELEHAGMWLQILADNFDNVYLCRGNHEQRWMNMNCGHVGMQELLAMTLVTDGYKVTMDDHMILTNGGKQWLCCHPHNFRQVNLSVVRDLAAKYEMNIIGAHGHQWAQGIDRSGKHVILDGGGMFDNRALEYLRDTTCFPNTQGGYYLLIDGHVEPFINDLG